MGFFKPSVAKLVERRDISGLVAVVVGSDSALASEAAPAVGRLIAEKHAGPEVESGVRALERAGNAPALIALTGVLRHDFSGSDYGKSLAAAALFRLGAIAVLSELILDIRRSDRKGEALHNSLSRDLIDMAVARGNVEFIEFLLVNGVFQMGSEVTTAYDVLLSRGGIAGVGRVIDDPRLFSGVSKERGFLVAGRKFTSEDIIKPWVRDGIA